MTTSRRFQVRQASQDRVRAVCAAAKPAGGGGHRADESVPAEGAQPAVHQDGGILGASVSVGVNVGGIEEVKKIIKNIMTVGESPPTGEAVDGRLPRSATTDESPEFKQITRRGRGGGASGASGAVLDARRGKVSRKAPITEQVCPFYSTPDAPFSIPLPLLQTLKISGPVL